MWHPSEDFVLQKKVEDVESTELSQAFDKVRQGEMGNSNMFWITSNTRRLSLHPI